MIRFALMTTAACGLCGCTQTQTRNTALDEMEAVMVNGVLTSWHLAADQGLYEFYFDQMTDDAIFLGTDATERWTK